MGLPHSFSGETNDAGKPYTYQKLKTENLMDYVENEDKKDERLSLWKWQWLIVRGGPGVNEENQETK